MHVCVGECVCVWVCACAGFGVECGPPPPCQHRCCPGSSSHRAALQPQDAHTHTCTQQIRCKCMQTDKLRPGHKYTWHTLQVDCFLAGFTIPYKHVFFFCSHPPHLARTPTSYPDRKISSFWRASALPPCLKGC